MLASVVGAGLAGVTALLAYSAINEATKETVDREIDLQWMQASIDAMPKCHYLAYGSVSRMLHSTCPRCLPQTSFLGISVRSFLVFCYGKFIYPSSFRLGSPAPI